MGFLQIIYVGITAVLAALCAYSVIKEDDPAKAMSLGVVTIPLILRALSIK